MAIQLINSTSVGFDNTSSESLAVPTGTTVGHVLFFFGSCDGSGFSNPTGFTQVVETAINTNEHTTIFSYRVVQSGDPSNYTISTKLQGERGLAIFVSYSGVDVNNVIDSFSENTGGINTTAVFNNLTPTNDNSLVIACIGNENGNNGNSIINTWHGGITSIVDNVNAPTGTANGSASGALGAVIQTTATTIGGNTSMLDSSLWAAIQVVINEGNIGISGDAKYTNAITTVSTNSIISTGFIASDYDDARIVGVWTSVGVYKGMSWIRRFLSTTELELDFPLIDKDGVEVIQEIGDLFAISLNFSDLDTADVALEGKTVRLLQPLQFGTLNVSDSICFYDESKDVRVTTNLGDYAMRFNGGLIVFGHLYNYENKTFSNSVNFSSTDDGNAGNQLVVFSESAKVWWLGGSLTFQVTPARLPGGSTGTAAEWQKWWGISTNADIVSPGGGAAWSANPTDQEFINIDSNPNSLNAIGFRIADGILSGGSVKVSASDVIAPFGADANGNYVIGANPNERFTVIDSGWNLAKTTFWRSSNIRTQNIRCNNIITSERRCGSTANPGSNALNTAIASFYFSDSYTNVLENTKLSILKSDDSLEQNYIADSSNVINGEVLEATVTGFTEVIEDTNWTYNLYKYGYSFISGAFTTELVSTLSGDAKDVKLGGLINQIIDPEITVDKSTADSYITQENSNKAYDAAMALFYDNFLLEQDVPVTKSGNEIDFKNKNVILVGGSTGKIELSGNTYTLYTGTLGFNGNIITTGTVSGDTLSGGNVTITGTITDSGGIRATRTLQLTGLVNPSKVHIFNTAFNPTDLQYVINTQTVTTGNYQYVFAAGQNINASVRIDNLTNRVVEFDLNLNLENISIPISQQLDRIYENN